MLFAVIVVTGILGFSAVRNTRYSVDLERYYPRESPEIQFYENYKESFLDSNARTIIAVQTEESILTPSTIKTIATVTDSILNLDVVTEVSSITNAKYLVDAPLFGLMSFPYVSELDGEYAVPDSQLIANDPAIIGVLVSNDFKGFTLQVFTTYAMSQQQSTEFRQELEHLLKQAGFKEFYLGGRILGQRHILDTMQREMVLFTLLAAVIVLLVLGIMYRTVWGLLGPLLVIGVTIVWTLGVMAFFNTPLGLFSSIIPAILFVIGTSDVIHILHKYIDALRLGQAKVVALQNAYREVGKATLLTTVTTMIGFLTLLTSSIIPIKEFGVYSAIGVGSAFILTYTLFPAFLLLTPTPKVALTQNGEKTKKLLEKSYAIILRRAIPIALVFAMVVGLGLWTSSQLKADNFLTEELPDNDGFKQGAEYIEKNYSGMRTFEMAIGLKDTSEKTSFTDPKILHQIDTLEQYIRNSYNTKTMVSIASIARSIHYAKTGQDKAGSFPNRSELARINKDLTTMLHTSRASFIWNKEDNISRITGLVNDIGGYANNLKNDSLMQFANQVCPDLRVETTGIAYLQDQNTKRIVRDMLEGLAIAFLLVSLLIAMVYRSFKLVVIALIPNVIPLLAITIIMYLMGVDLNVSTSLIFAIAFGITVDDTIHFLSKLKIELDKGEEVDVAIKTTFLTTGKSIIITSIILFTGFIVLAFSGLASTFYFGLLVSFTILIAVITDLLLLPLFLKWLK